MTEAKKDIDPDIRKTPQERDQTARDAAENRAPADGPSVENNTFESRT